MPARFWINLTTEEFKSRDMSRAIAVLPIAAIEQHGPHLPVGVDSMINDGFLARVMPLIPEELDVLILPTQMIGKSDEHLAFPGTLTMSATTAIRAWAEIGESIYRAGCRKLVFANSHGGNVAVLEIVALDLRMRCGLLCVNAAWHRLGYPDNLFSPDELRHGIHGGEIETSLMLALNENCVRMDKASNFSSRGLVLEREATRLRATQPIGFGWMSQDLHPRGAMGNASAATKEKGQAILDHAAQAFIELLKDVNAFELDT